MIITENYFSTNNHFIHFFYGCISPSAIWNPTWLIGNGMNNVISRTITSRPRHIIISPHTTLINLVIPSMFFGRMPPREALIKATFSRYG